MKRLFLILTFTLVSVSGWSQNRLFTGVVHIGNAATKPVDPPLAQPDGWFVSADTDTRSAEGTTYNQNAFVWTLEPATNGASTAAYHQNLFETLIPSSNALEIGEVSTYGAFAQNSGAGQIGDMAAAVNATFQLGAGQVASAYGSQSSVYNISIGGIVNEYGIFSAVGNLSSAGDVSGSAYSFFAATPAVTGLVSSTYQFYAAANPVGINNPNAWAFYDAGPNDKDQFGLIFATNQTLTGPAPAVSQNQVGFGSTVVPASYCGSLPGSAGCLVINVSGTPHYVPYY